MYNILEWYCSIVFWHWILLYGNPIPLYPSQMSFFLSGYSNNSLFSRCNSSNMICLTIKNHVFSFPGTWYNLAKWKCRFIFQGRFPIILALNVSSVSMWAFYIKNAIYLYVGSSFLVLFLCKLRPNYFHSFAFFLYSHWLSQVTSALVIWFLLASVMWLVFSNLCIGSLMMLFRSLICFFRSATSLFIPFCCFII